MSDPNSSVLSRRAALASLAGLGIGTAALPAFLAPPLPRRAPAAPARTETVEVAA